MVIDGNHLSIPEVVAAGRYGVQVVLDESDEVRTRMLKSQKAIDDKLESGRSVYGISTGFGGSGMSYPFSQTYDKLLLSCTDTSNPFRT